MSTIATCFSLLPYFLTSFSSFSLSIFSIFQHHELVHNRTWSPSVCHPSLCPYQNKRRNSSCKSPFVFSFSFYYFKFQAKEGQSLSLRCDVDDTSVAIIWRKNDDIVAVDDDVLDTYGGYEVSMEGSVT